MSLVMLLLTWVASGALWFAQAAPAPAPAPPPAPAPAAATAPAQAPDTSGYVWEATCKECHAEVHEAWARTKHKTALLRLSAADQEKECGACHLTGADKPVAVEGKTVNAGVQCESCHGAGREHVDSARAGSPKKFAKTPGESLCVECHNAKSPHFHGFFYAAMKPLVHKVK